MYAEYAYENKLVDETQYEKLKAEYAKCDKMLKNGEGFLAFMYCEGIGQEIIGNPPKFNYYDIRKECEGPLCYDFSKLDTFMNEDSIKQ